MTNCVVRNISFSVLMKDNETKDIIKSGDKERFEDILYRKWGVDVFSPWEVVSCHHRPLEQSPETFNGPMVIGVERTDSSWIESGEASFEAQVAARNDISLMMDVARMGKQNLNSLERKYTTDKYNVE